MKAVVIFSFDRPGILRQCLTSLGIPDNVDIHLLQDGAINPHSRKLKTDPVKIHECVETFKELVPGGTVHNSPINLGVGLNHLRAYEYIFEEKKYDMCTFFDDDTLCSNVDALFKICDRTRSIPDVMGADALPIPYKYPSDEEKVMLCDTWKYHIAYLAFTCCREKYMSISDLYKKKIHEFCDGVDYTMRDYRRIQKYLNHEFGSQDWVRDRCFREFGMTKKAITSRPMTRNIGEHGVHMRPDSYRFYKFDQTVPEEVTGEGEIVDEPVFDIHINRSEPYPDIVKDKN